MIGVDIVYLPRFTGILQGIHGNAFIDRVFSKEDLLECESQFAEERVKYLAKCYAAKEAVIKASMGTIDLTDLKDIAIRKEVSGRFFAYVKKENATYGVSMSKDGDYAIGIAILLS